MSAEISNPTLLVEVPTSSTVKSKFEEVQNSIDGPDLVPLLQCIGFSLQGTDKHDNLEELHQLLKNKEENSIKVEITCVKSGTKVTLVKDGCCCKCPSDDGQLWNVSGVSAQGNVSMTKSNLVPTISSAKSKTINTLLLKCMEFIVFTNANDRIDTFEEFKQPCGMPKVKSNECLKPDQNLSKIASPPKHSSSPIVDVGKSLRDSRVSLDGSESLVDLLKEVNRKVKRAIEMASKTNATFTKTPKSDVLKISPLASTSNDSVQTENKSVVNLVEFKSTPANNNTPKKQSQSTGAKKKGLVPPSRLNLLKYKKDVASSSLGRTPSSSMVKDRPGKSLNISAAKLKSAISVDPGLQSKIKPRIPAFSSKIGLKK